MLKWNFLPLVVRASTPQNTRKLSFQFLEHRIVNSRKLFFKQRNSYFVCETFCVRHYLPFIEGHFTHLAF